MVTIVSALAITTSGIKAQELRRAQTEEAEAALKSLLNFFSFLAQGH